MLRVYESELTRLRNTLSRARNAHRRKRENFVVWRLASASAHASRKESTPWAIALVLVGKFYNLHVRAFKRIYRTAQLTSFI